FYAACYYKQPNPALKINYGKELIELDFSTSYSLKNIRRFYKLIKKIKPDIIHLHHGVSAFQGAMLARFAGVKYIFKTEHNDHKFYTWYQKIVTVPILLMTDRIICNSKSTANSFYPWEKWIAKNKTTVIYNGINVIHIIKFNTEENYISVRKKYNIKDDELLLVSTGRLIKQKNYERLIRAAATVCKNQKIQLLIAGGGHQEALLTAIIKEEGMSDKIKLLGMVQRDEVYRILNAADIFVMPSLWEGFCNALVEAMAAGKPVLISGINTLREVAGDDAAIFFNPTSTESIERAIIAAINLPKEKLQALVSAAKERACNNFTLEKTAERYIHQYLEHGKK
ncbi:MAG: glycosyltransferase family 4 protein, partial [Parafilimonas sp.]